MRSITYWAITHHNKNIAVVVPTAEIGRYIYDGILRKLTRSSLSFSSSVSKISMKNGTRIFIEREKFNNDMSFRGISIDVILFHELVSGGNRHDIERVMVPQIGRGCMVGTLTT